jgi:hypothetical protein
MAKPTITKLFVGGIVALFAGLFLMILAIIVAFGARAITVTGTPPTAVEVTTFGWTMIGLASIGCLTVFGGAIAGLVAWIGAVVNTAQLEDKTWFIVLLVLGLLSFGFIGMLAYVIAGPDGTLRVRQPSVQPAA